MKPGSKAWEKMIRRYFFVTRGVCALALILLLVQQIMQINLYANLIGLIGFGSLGLFFLLSAFSPIYENPRWEIVFPELRNKETEKQLRRKK